MNYKIVIPVSAVVVVGIVASISGMFSSSQKSEVTNSIYDFTMNGLDGKPIDFNSYRGKKILIVNTASKCGLTPQYEGLEKLHEQYRDKVTVLGFPANNFLWQEPGTNEEIANFCEKNYGVQFQMFQKISVKGSDKHPLYKWLEAKTGETPDWNFSKYLVSEDGNEVTFFKSGTQPLAPEIINKISK